MSVVSAQLGLTMVPRSKHIGYAVQYDKNDSGEPEPADFTQGAQKPTFNISKYIQTPSLDLLPKQYPAGVVPLKSEQMNTRPYGSALFDAPFETDIAELPMRMIKRGAMKVDVEFEETEINVPPPLPYNHGISTRSVPIKFDDIELPSAALYRR